MMWLRALWIIDLLWAIFLMLEAEVQNNKPLCGVGLIFVLLCLWMARSIRYE